MTTTWYIIMLLPLNPQVIGWLRWLGWFVFVCSCASRRSRGWWSSRKGGESRREEPMSMMNLYHLFESKVESRLIMSREQIEQGERMRMSLAAPVSFGERSR
jgi:hypothetical protein